MRTLLYYPQICLPPGAWVRRAVLYWDRLAAIVPAGVQVDLTGDIPDLMEHDAFAMIRPSLLMERGLLGGFRDDVSELLQVTTPAPYRAPFGIHRNKLLHALPDDLLARVGRGQDGPWFLMERAAAFAYMGVLARHLADAWDDVAYPGTDRESRLRPIVRPVGRGEAGVELSLSLPAPAPGVSLKKIMRFRGQRRDELLRFRVLLDEFADGLAAVATDGNPGDLKHHSEVFLEAVEREQAVLSRLLDDSLIKTAWTTLKEVVTLKEPTVLGTSAAAGAGAAVFSTWESAVLGVGAVVAIQVARTRKERKDAFTASPVAYLHSAGRSGLLG